MTDDLSPSTGTNNIALQTNIFKAIAKARSEFPSIPKTRTATIRIKSGGQYSYTYADLSDVLDAISDPMCANGLTAHQTPMGTDLITVIAHESGETITGQWPIKPMPTGDLNSCQGYQAAIQVAKRYALTAMLNITTEESVEGDPRARKKMPTPVKENFDTSDGIRMPKGAKFEKGMTPRQMAEAAATAIEGQFDDVKTQVGLNGVWNRNEDFIDLLNKKQSDLFDNVYEKFNTLMASMEESAA